MSAYETKTIEVTAGGGGAANLGQAVDVGQMLDKWVTLTGFSGDTVSVEITDEADPNAAGVTWYSPSDVSGLTADTTEPIELPAAASFIRTNHSAGTTATIECRVRGMNLGKVPPPETTTR